MTTNQLRTVLWLPKVFLLLLLLLLFLGQLVTHTHASPILTTTTTTLPYLSLYKTRGGGSDARIHQLLEPSPIFSIGIIQSQDHDQSQGQPLSVTLVGVQRGTTSQQTTLPNDAIETLALVSDIIIIDQRNHTITSTTSTTMHSNNNNNNNNNKNYIDTVWKHIHQAALRRATTNRKLSIVLLTTSDTETTLPDLLPIELLEQFHIVTTMKDAKAIGRNILSLHDSVKATTTATTTAMQVDSKQEYDLTITRIYQWLTANHCPNFLNWKDTNDYNNNNHETNQDDHDIANRILPQIQSQLSALEEQQHLVWLPTNNDLPQVPLLHFGTEANHILMFAKDYIPPSLHTTYLPYIASQLATLYQEQLEALREHYGRLYEHMIYNNDNHNEGNENNRNRNRNPQQWTAAAARVTEGFRAAAQQAIPTLCQEGAEVANADFSYATTLHGLLNDMMEATQAMQDGAEQSDNDDDIQDTQKPSKRPPVKWYQKLAARVVVLGFNYCQGWLAWQGVRRAAAERDRDMPKFPLF